MITGFQHQGLENWTDRANGIGSFIFNHYTKIE